MKDTQRLSFKYFLLILIYNMAGNIVILIYAM